MKLKNNMFFILSKFANILIKNFYILTGNKFPQFVSVVAIIRNDKKEFLIQDRADKKGYCLPGGLTKIKESLEDNIKREVLEETGYKISNIKFLFYKNVDNIYKYSLTIVFEAKIKEGNLKNSWEGKALWKSFSDIKNNMAFDHDKIIKRYLKDFN